LIFPIEKMNQDTLIKIVVFIPFAAAILIGLYRVTNKQIGYGTLIFITLIPLSIAENAKESSFLFYLSNILFISNDI